MRRIEHKILNGIECKKCAKCCNWKTLDEFTKHHTKWDGLRGKCKECTNKNIVYEKIIDGEIYKKCGKCDQLKHINCFGNNPAHSGGKNNYCKSCYSLYRKNNDNIKNGKKKWNVKNREILNKKRREKYNKDIQFKIKMRLRCRLYESIKEQYGVKAYKTIDMLGCTVAHLMQWLESKFSPGMSWDNHGLGDDKWHIDHIIPCASFDLTDESQQKECFHYTNLQPLWQKDNLSKGDSIVNENL